MIYEASQRPFSEELFRNPTRDYRGAPFWSWNGKLNRETLERQIQTLRQMGFGGYHIHARIGLETEYLGEEFLALVRHCEQFGDRHDMLTWLYDEDKWPSGVGGGRVTCDRQFASRYLLFSPMHYPDGYLDRRIPQTSRLTKNGDIRQIRRYAVRLEDGRLAGYRPLDEADGPAEGEQVWYAYLVVTERLRWFNNQPYVDTLNPKAIERFIEVTHERYYAAVGERFSRTIPAIFTDEPSFHKQEELADGRVPQDVGVAYTEDMEASFRRRYGTSLLDHLPELFWERADGAPSQIRYQYHDCVAWMFSEAYGKTLGDWCDAHDLMLTGHLLFEESLESQSRVVGEVMRTLRHFALPGIDMLADRHEYTTAKQAQSVARQYGRVGAMSELYGVTNWNFDFRGHKHQGDWQAALGITVRVPHLAWMAMGGESKRDYPAPIDDHSPWYTQYHRIEDYFARVNTALTRGRARCRIGLVHPVESYWTMMGPNRDTARQRQQLDRQFHQVTEWLLFNLLDFDFVSEALLPELYEPTADGKLHLGQMAYEAIVLPAMTTMRRETLDALKAFAAAGGKVIFLGGVPACVDGALSEAPAAFAQSVVSIGFDCARLLAELEPYRDVEVLGPDFLRSERLIYQLREEPDGQRYLFLAQGKHDNRLELNHWVTQTGREDFTVRVRGLYTAQLLDAMTGRIAHQSVSHEDGWTVMCFGVYPHDSLLLRLQPAATAVRRELALPERLVRSETYLPCVADDYALAEPNVLLLDQAEYRMDDGPWQPREEILRLDDAVRRQWGYPLRTESFPQPWLEPEKPIEHTLELRFVIPSRVALPSVDVAYEAKSAARLFWNGTEVPVAGGRWYVDADIHRETLGPLQAGENELRIVIPFGPGVNVEWCYLLGQFGVEIAGDRGMVTALPERLAFGDIARQGFPFYGGNLRYDCTVVTDGSDVELEVPEYYGALLEASLDGQSHAILFEPYRAVFRDVPAGEHRLSVTLYGTRINTFGQLHNCNRKEEYYGPKTWRTTGKNWTYLYQLHPVGVTVTPILRMISD